MDRKTLQFLIDNICADFTVDSLLGVARDCLSGGSTTVADISRAIMDRDGSLDTGCADGLAEGVVNALADVGEAEIRESVVYPK